MTDLGRKLNALVARWRQDTEHLLLGGGGPFDQGYADGFVQAANELSNLLWQHTVAECAAWSKKGREVTVQELTDRLMAALHVDTPDVVVRCRVVDLRAVAAQLIGDGTISPPSTFTAPTNPWLSD